MLFVLEMIMLMVGIRVLLKGTLPRIPFVRPRYRLGKRAMKLLGAVLVIPIPLTVVVSLLLKLVLREAALGYDVALDWVVFAGTVAAVLVIVRRMWKS